MHIWVVVSFYTLVCWASFLSPTYEGYGVSGVEQFFRKAVIVVCMAVSMYRW